MDQSKSARRSAWLLVFAMCILGSWGSDLGALSAAGGPLRRHPTNPRYFTDGSGKAIYLTGSHVWHNLQDRAGQPNFDYNGYLTFMVQRNHNFMRMWAQEHFRYTPLAYQRNGPGTAADGGLKVDLSKFNQGYFDRLRSRVIAARDRGIYVSIMLFQGWSIEWKETNYNMWPIHPFNAANNINGINGDPNGDGQGREVHMLSVPAITALQDAYVRKVIDTVNDLDNVLYEISNESHTQSVSWQYHMIDLIHKYEAGKPKRHPVGMTALGFADPKFMDNPGNNAPLNNSPADWISPFGGNDIEGYINNPPASSGAKVVLPDTDHLWGNGGTRAWVWKSFLRGLNPIFMDVTPPLADWVLATGDDVRWAMGRTRSYATEMNLAAMAPQNGLSSTGYCLANAGNEYLLYQSGSGAFTVNLAAATYAYEWFNPATGAMAGTGNITAAAGNRSFTAPFSGDAVLYLKATAAAPTPALVPPVITSPANGTSFASTTTQVTVTWNAVPGAAGYLVRCTDTGTGSFVTYQDRYTQTQISIPVSAGRSYRFWIHSHSAAFTSSDPSTWSPEAVLLFSVSATSAGLQPPTITSPANGTTFASTTTQVTVRWNPVAGAAGYLVRCQEPGATSFVVYLDRYPSLEVNVPVAAGRSYRFWVHSHSAAFTSSNPSTWSPEAVVQFSVAAPSSTPTPLAVPTITAPSANQVFPSSTTVVTLRWDPVPGAAGYLLRALDLTTGAQILYRDMYIGTSINLPVVRGHSYRFWMHSASSSFSFSNPSSFSGQANRYFSVAN